MLGYLGLVAAGLSGVSSVPSVVLPLPHDAADRPVAPAPSPGAALADAAGRGPNSPAQVTVPPTAPPAGAPQPVSRPGGASGPAPSASGAAPAVFAVPTSAAPQATASPHGQGLGQGTAAGKPTARPTPARR
jgi:hypothetical protein